MEPRQTQTIGTVENRKRKINRTAEEDDAKCIPKKYSNKNILSYDYETVWPSPGLTLPTELLWEMTKFMGFEGLHQCCQANFQLNALTHSAAMKTKQKLEDLYLGDVRLLASWFQCWMAINQEIRAELLKQTAVAHDWLKCGVKKDAIGKEQCRSQLITIAALIDEFRQSLDLLGNKMMKMVEIDELPNPFSSGRFHLSSGCQLHFIKLRRNFLEKIFLTARAQLQRWLTEGVPEWAAMNRYFCTFLTANFHQELARCTQGIIRCNQRGLQCQLFMSRYTTKLALHEI